MQPIGNCFHMRLVIKSQHVCVRNNTSAGRCMNHTRPCLRALTKVYSVYYTPNQDTEHGHTPPSPGCPSPSAPTRSRKHISLSFYTGWSLLDAPLLGFTLLPLLGSGGVTMPAAAAQNSHEEEAHTRLLSQLPLSTSSSTERFPPLAVGPPFCASSCPPARSRRARRALCASAVGRSWLPSGNGGCIWLWTCT